MLSWSQICSVPPRLFPPAFELDPAPINCPNNGPAAFIRLAISKLEAGDAVGALLLVFWLRIEVSEESNFELCLFLGGKVGRAPELLFVVSDTLLQELPTVPLLTSPELDPSCCISFFAWSLNLDRSMDALVGDIRGLRKPLLPKPAGLGFNFSDCCSKLESG